MTAEQQKLVTDNMRLVPHAIKRYVSKHVMFEMDDIFQNGYYGLCQAAIHFDPTKGYAFSTFASRCILVEIQHHMRAAKAKCRDYRKCATTFDQPIDSISGDTLGSLVPAVDDVDSIVGANLLFDYIHRAKDIDTRVVTLYIDGFNQPEIARIVGKSQSYISRCLKAARASIQTYYKKAM